MENASKNLCLKKPFPKKLSPKKTSPSRQRRIEGYIIEPVRRWMKMGIRSVKSKSYCRRRRISRSSRSLLSSTGGVTDGYSYWLLVLFIYISRHFDFSSGDGSAKWRWKTCSQQFSSAVLVYMKWCTVFRMEGCSGTQCGSMMPFSSFP